MFVLFPCFAIANNVIVPKPKMKFHGDEQIPPSISELYAKEIKQVENYMNGFSTLSAVFKQASKTGMISYGKIYIAKPGKIRCEYLNPTKLLLIINNSRVTLYDKEIDEISYSSTEANALQILASENVDFAKLNLVELEKENHFISLSVKEYNKDLKQNIIVTFKFLYPEIALKQITIHTENEEMNIVLQQIEYNRTLPKKMFFFNKSIKDSF